MQRLMLTPLYRNLLRIGLPFAIAFGSMTIYMSDDTRREAVVTSVTDLRDQFQSRPEFMVSLMAIDGASTTVAEDIREILQLDFPVSSFDLELEAILTTIRDLPAVADARVRVRSGGILQVDVTERVPAVLWRTAEGLEVLDADGMITGPAASREEFATLPLIAGEGADKHVTEALDLVRAAGPLGARMRGLVRIGERRWDVVLDRDQRILLPEDAPVQALERVIALGQVHEMLERDLAVVDMRLSARPTIRMNPAAVEQWRELQGTNAGIAGR
jgi:cell division protein FtsQ